MTEAGGGGLSKGGLKERGDWGTWAVRTPGPVPLLYHRMSASHQAKDGRLGGQGDLSALRTSPTLFTLHCVSDHEGDLAHSIREGLRSPGLGGFKLCRGEATGLPLHLGAGQLLRSVYTITT